MINSITLRFHGVDSWSRPVYKVQDLNVYVGSTDTLLPDVKVAPNGTVEEINEYFRTHVSELVIFGNTFDEHDPLGTPIKKSLAIEILDDLK